MRWKGVAAWGIATSVASGCSQMAMVPPVRSLAMETPGPLEAGTWAVDGRGGQHFAVFGPGLSHGSVRVRHGLPGRTEVGLGGQLLRVDGAAEDAMTETRRLIGMASGSFKLTPGRRQRAFALSSGLGGGWSPGGTLFGADVGAILGIENPWMTPFFNARVMLGVPVTSREVDLGPCGDCPDDRLRVAPRLSLTESIVVGAKFVFPEFRSGRTWVGIRVLAGEQLAWIQDIDRRDAPPPDYLARRQFFASYGAGLEITLGRVRQWPAGWKSSYPGLWPR